MHLNASSFRRGWVIIAGMNPDLITALAVFAFVSSITPGPNNLMLMSSGANFGLWRSIPHMLGISLGLGCLILVMGAGISGVIDAYPQLYQVLKIAAVVYMLWLAWKIAHAAPINGQDPGRPLTLMQAVWFQWVNPKAIAMAITAVSVYSGDGSMVAILAVAGVFCAICLPSIASWTVLGQQMSRFLKDRARLRAFNIVMALLLVASLYPVIYTG